MLSDVSKSPRLSLMDIYKSCCAWRFELAAGNELQAMFGMFRKEQDRPGYRDKEYCSPINNTLDKGTRFDTIKKYLSQETKDEIEKKSLVVCDVGYSTVLLYYDFKNGDPLKGEKLRVRFNRPDQISNLGDNDPCFSYERLENSWNVTRLQAFREFVFVHPTPKESASLFDAAEKAYSEFIKICDKENSIEEKLELIAKIIFFLHKSMSIYRGNCSITLVIEAYLLMKCGITPQHNDIFEGKQHELDLVALTISDEKIFIKQYTEARTRNLKLFSALADEKKEETPGSGCAPTQESTPVVPPKP